MLTSEAISRFIDNLKAQADWYYEPPHLVVKKGANMIDAEKAMEAAIEMLRDFMRTLLDADMRYEDAINRAYDLAIDLVPSLDMPVMATNAEANHKRQAATLLKAAINER